MKTLTASLWVACGFLCALIIGAYAWVVISSLTMEDGTHGRSKVQLVAQSSQVEEIPFPVITRPVTGVTPYVNIPNSERSPTPIPGLPTIPHLSTEAVTLFPSFTSLPTLAPSTLTPTLESQPSPTFSPPDTATLSGQESFPPASARVDGVNGNAQLYSLDCEARSAVDLAAFYGVSIDEIEFLSKLPQSDNPEIGFVGSVTDPRGHIPPKSYGVHAGPVAEVLRNYGLKASEERGLSWDSLRAEIASGRPIIAWVVGNTWAGYSGVFYTPSNGHTITVVPWEHTVIVVGYSADEVYLIDGSMSYSRTVAQFIDSWGVLGNMAIYVQP